MKRVACAIGGVAPRSGRAIGKLADAVDRQRFIDRAAAQWVRQPIQSRTAPIDVIVLVGTNTTADIRISELGSDVAARRLGVLQDEDWDDLTMAYRRWAYAVSDPSAWLADFQQKRTRLLDQLIAGKAVFAVDHPQDVGLAGLFHELEGAVARICSQSH